MSCSNTLRTNTYNRPVNLIFPYGAGSGTLTISTNFDIPDDAVFGNLVSLDGEETPIAVSKTAIREIQFSISADDSTVIAPQGGWYIGIDYGNGDKPHIIGGEYRVEREGVSS